jgi:hypothetical protein
MTKKEKNKMKLIKVRKVWSRSPVETVKPDTEVKDECEFCGMYKKHPEVCADCCERDR